MVAMAIVGNAFLNGVGDGIATAAQHANLDADVSDDLNFAQLYASTFALSATLTVAAAIYFIPPLYGTQVSYLWPCLVIVLGAGATGISVPATSSTPVANAIAALKGFVIYYGYSFWGGAIVGIIGAAIIYVVYSSYR